MVGGLSRRASESFVLSREIRFKPTLLAQAASSYHSLRLAATHSIEFSVLLRERDMAETLSIRVNDNDTVTGLVYAANKRQRLGVTLLLGHGAGADQTSTFMVDFATALAARG